MSTYAAHRRKLAKRSGAFHVNVSPADSKPANDVRPASRAVRRSRSNRRHGLDNEHRVIASFSSGALPRWFVSIRPATHEEDMAGVDAWVTTVDAGDIGVQVKSSAARAAQFREKHPEFVGAVVVVHPAMGDDEIRWLVLNAVRRAMVRVDCSENEEEKGKAA